MSLNVKSRIKPTGFYVYAYICRSTNLPYYIGKGIGRRLYVSHRKHGISTPKNLDYIVVLEQDLTEVGALALERRYIRWYGRKDLRTGLLHNKTDGGETSTGNIKTSEQIEKHRAKVSGRVSWTDGVRSVRSFTCPGPGWTRGNAQSGKKWWNDGSKEQWSYESPPGWQRGRLPKIREHLKSISLTGDMAAAKVRWGHSV